MILCLLIFIALYSIIVLVTYKYFDRVYDTYSVTMVKCIVHITCKQRPVVEMRKKTMRFVALGKLAGYDLGRSSKVGCGDSATIDGYKYV